MLEPAIKYKDQLQSLQYDIWFDDKYKYWNNSIYYSGINVDPDTWNRHQFVSVYNNEVIGYISYDISRSDDVVHSLSIMNFSNNKITFGRDVMQALKDIFEKYKFRKLSFSVVVGNPIEKTYDKMIKKYGGRIVGIQKEDVKLIDGEYYDRKSYEILAKDYFTVIKGIEREKMYKALREANEIKAKILSDHHNDNHHWVCDGRNAKDNGFIYHCDFCGKRKEELDPKNIRRK